MPSGLGDLDVLLQICSVTPICFGKFAVGSVAQPGPELLRSLGAHSPCAAAFSVLDVLLLQELFKAYWRRVARGRLAALPAPTASVRASAAAVVRAASHVEVSTSAINRLAASLSTTELEQMRAPAAFDKSIHFVDGGAHTVQYLLLVDALNFCFWPRASLTFSQHTLTFNFCSWPRSRCRVSVVHTDTFLFLAPCVAATHC